MLINLRDALVASVVAFASMVNADSEEPKTAQTVPLEAEFKTHLDAKNTTRALEIAERLFAIASEAPADHAASGRYARAVAQLNAIKARKAQAADWYLKCADGFERAQQNEQIRIECLWSAGTGYGDAYEYEKAKETFKRLIHSLEGKPSNETNGYISLSYVMLAQLHEPRMTAKKNVYRLKQKQYLNFAERAIQAVEAEGQTGAFVHALALYELAKAQELMKNKDLAASYYEEVVRISSAVGAEASALQTSAATRLAFVGGEPLKKKKTVEVETVSGETITLKIISRKSVKLPKPKGTQAVNERAYARLQISLQADGKVDSVEVIQSGPDEYPGIALSESVKQWRFEGPESVALDELPPFELGYVFGVVRR